MRRTRCTRCPNDQPRLPAHGVLAYAVVVVGLPATLSIAQPADEPSVPAAAPKAEAGAAPAPDKLSIEEAFRDYLHYVVMGKFAEADAHAVAVLKHEDLDPLRMLALSDKYRNSMDMLLKVVANTAIGQNARKIIEVIREGETLKRKDPKRVVANLELLAGTPTQRALGLERLRESGEYAVPWFIQALADPNRKSLHPYLIRALPKIGRSALNPLVIALRMENDAVRGSVIEALGKLGYPQALPYLARVAESSECGPDIVASAKQAIAQIVAGDPAATERPAHRLFLELAEGYYANMDSLRPDPTEMLPNIWFLRENVLTPVGVLRGIYDEVMCMRCCEAVLELRPNEPAAAALWLAANFRREAALGLDVESEALPGPDAEVDPIHPQPFPRSIYFARTAGPRYAHQVLARAVKDRDRHVALGAVAALSVTAGSRELVGPEDENQPLAQALRFPDLLVRIRAATAIARSLPVRNFDGDSAVVPILASTLSLTGTKQVLVIDPDEASRNALRDALAGDDVNVLAAAGYNDGLNRAAEELTHLDVIFLATDLTKPDAVAAVASLRKHDLYALTPLVLVVKTGGYGMAARITDLDPSVVRLVLPQIPDVMPEDQLADLGKLASSRWAVAAEHTGQRPTTPETALALALEAVDTLRTLALSRSPIFDLSKAEGAIIAALNHPAQELRVPCAALMALWPSSASQQAIARFALSSDQAEPFRVAAFGSLAESARRNGNLLTDDLTQPIQQIATAEENLTLRTAASQALGALNLPSDRVSRIIRMHRIE